MERARQNFRKGIENRIVYKVIAVWIYTMTNHTDPLLEHIFVRASEYSDNLFN